MKFFLPFLMVLYGGSVNLANCAKLTAQREVDGLFIGRSAWQADNYITILQLATKSKQPERKL